MRNGLIISYNSIAARLAMEDADVQAEFIRTFLTELSTMCETAYNTDMQIASINLKLTKKAKELLGALSFLPPEEN